MITFSVHDCSKKLGEIAALRRSKLLWHFSQIYTSWILFQEVPVHEQVTNGSFNGILGICGVIKAITLTCKACDLKENWNSDAEVWKLYLSIPILIVAKNCNHFQKAEALLCVLQRNCTINLPFLLQSTACYIISLSLHHRDTRISSYTLLITEKLTFIFLIENSHPF